MAWSWTFKRLRFANDDEIGFELLLKPDPGGGNLFS